MQRIQLNTLTLLLCVFTLISSKIALAKPVTTPLNPSELVVEQRYRSPKISPDGSKIVVYLQTLQKGQLVIYNANTFETEGVITLKDKQFIWNFNWVSNERIVFETAFKKAGSYDIHSFGEIFGVNYDGSNPELLFGFRAGDDKLSAKRRLHKKKSAQQAWGSVAHWLPNDPKHILIEVEPWSKDGSSNSSLFTLNVKSGHTDRVTPRAPTDSTSFYLDQQGDVIFINGIEETEKTANLVYRLVDNHWTLFRQLPANSTFKALGYTHDKKGIYLLANVDINQTPVQKRDKIGLYRLDLNDNTQTLLYENERVDLEYPIYDETNAFIGVEFNDGYPSYLTLPSHAKENSAFSMFSSWFDGHTIRIISRTLDGKKCIVFVSSDTMPGTYFLFDTASKKPVQLFRHLKLNQRRFTYTQPIQFTSFDNTIIDGYLTTRTPHSPSPTVILIHGGPILRDYADFDAEVQLLASRGYTVLQINYRGSSGYGRRFEQQGYQHWGDHIQQDILAGLDWAIAAKHTNKHEVCIMGSSFGAYSAMMSAVLRPNAFQCVIANAGVYDLKTLFEDSDIPKAFWGTNYLTAVLGDNESQLEAFSPVNNAEKIQAAVLLAHGRTDARTPFINAEKMVAALQKTRKARKHAVETYFKDYETHGFTSADNQIAYLEKVLTFLKKHLK